MEKNIRKSNVLLIGITLIILFTIVSIYFVSRSRQNVLGPETLTTRMKLNVQYYVFKQGYTTPILTIENLNDVSWKDCEITINNKYSSKLSSIPSVYAEDNYQIIPLSDFATKDEVKMEDMTSNIKTACIYCTTPYGDFCGEFK